MLRKSFTFFELLVSLVVLTLVLTIVLKLFTTDDNLQIYYELQEIENQYYQTGFAANTQKIQLHQY